MVDDGYGIAVLLPCNADGPVGAVGGGIPSLRSGIPPQVVMKWTGHSDYKTMKPYIDIAEKVKAEQMSIFEKGLDG